MGEIAVTLVEKGGESKDAQHYLDKLGERDPESPVYKRLMGLSQEDLGKVDHLLNLHGYDLFGLGVSKDEADRRTALGLIQRILDLAPGDTKTEDAIVGNLHSFLG